MNVFGTNMVIRWRSIGWILLLILSGYWILTILYSLVADVCSGKDHVEFLCNQYKRGHIGGSLCEKLCTNKEIKLNHCQKQDAISSVFLWQHWLVKVHRQNVEMRLNPYNSFSEPKEGTPMTEFRAMVSTLIQSKLGDINNEDIMDTIMQIADSDRNSKVTLAEAKSIWALLQQNEFFFHVIFLKSDHLPTFQGHCGDLYAIEYHPHQYIYDNSGMSLKKTTYPGSWFLPSWNQRGKIMVGLLEFILEIYQHGTAGSFHMCNLNAKNIGYNKKFDVKISDTSNILSANELSSILEARHCTSDRDCAYSQQCFSTCDLTKNRCTGAIINPNLYYACKLIETYLLKDAPFKLYREMDILLGRCHLLTGATSDQMAVEHSLVLNDLKSLIWNQISYEAGSKS